MTEVEKINIPLIMVQCIFLKFSTSPSRVLDPRLKLVVAFAVVAADVAFVACLLGSLD